MDRTGNHNPNSTPRKQERISLEVASIMSDVKGDAARGVASMYGRAALAHQHMEQAAAAQAQTFQSVKDGRRLKLTPFITPENTYSPEASVATVSQATFSEQVATAEAQAEQNFAPQQDASKAEIDLSADDTYTVPPYLNEEEDAIARAREAVARAQNQGEEPFAEAGAA